MPKKIARSAIRQKKLRTEQVRNAQRRRRERLKAENLGFLQLILPETLRLRLVTEAEKAGISLQEKALNLIAEGMGEKHLIEAIPIRKSNKIKPVEKDDVSTGDAPVNNVVSKANTSESVQEIESDSKMLSINYPTENQEDACEIKDEMSLVDEEFSSTDDRLVELEELETFPTEDEPVFSVVPDPEPGADEVVENDDVSASASEEAGGVEAADIQSLKPSSEEEGKAQPEQPVARARGKKKADTSQMELF